MWRFWRGRICPLLGMGMVGTAAMLAMLAAFLLLVQIWDWMQTGVWATVPLEWVLLVLDVHQPYTPLLGVNKLLNALANAWLGFSILGLAALLFFAGIYLGFPPRDIEQHYAARAEARKEARIVAYRRSKGLPL